MDALVDLSGLWRYASHPATILGEGIVVPGVDLDKISNMAKKKEITEAYESFRPKRKRQGPKIGMRLRIRKLLQSFPSVKENNKEGVQH